MAQQLILPINKCKLNASYKTQAYKSEFGFTHYGVDLISSILNRKLYASGGGTVVATGWDNVVGNVVAVEYKGAVNTRTGAVKDVVFRYFHLGSISVKKGQQVNKDTMLGMYGATGQFVQGAHLHLEVDTDTKRPLYTPTVTKSNLLKGTSANANDKTIENPMDWLHVKPLAPDYQEYTTANDKFIRAEDKHIEAYREPAIEPPAGATDDVVILKKELKHAIENLELEIERCKELESENETLKKDNDRHKAEVVAFKDKLDKIAQIAG